MNYIATARLFLTADKKRVVSVASPEAGYLFRAPGHVVTQAEVDYFGLDGSDMVKPMRAQETKAVLEVPENKAVLEVPEHEAVLEVPAKKTKKEFEV